MTVITKITENNLIMNAPCFLSKAKVELKFKTKEAALRY